MRKWIMSACVMLAWCILPIVALTGSRDPGHQTIISVASYTQSTLADEPAAASHATVTSHVSVTPQVKAPAATWTVRPGDTLSAIATALAVPGGWPALYQANRQAIGADPGLIHPGAVLVLPGEPGPVRYAVGPGDTLSSIAGALAVPGGWRALYAVNRRTIGPDPDVIRPGIILVTPGQAFLRPVPRPAPVSPVYRPPVVPSGSSPRQAAPRQPAPGSRAAPATVSRPVHRGSAQAAPVSPAGGLPQWLLDVLIATGALTAAAFIVEPASVVVRRRNAARHALPRRSVATSVRARRAATKARIVLADHERLIVTYSIRDHTVYVLTPPGEDPQAVLRAARLVLPDETYEELAGHLGVPSDWPYE